MIPLTKLNYIKTKNPKCTVSHIWKSSSLTFDIKTCYKTGVRDDWMIRALGNASYCNRCFCYHRDASEDRFQTHLFTSHQVES